jgi:hypothetical protein
MQHSPMPHEERIKSALGPLYIGLLKKNANSHKGVGSSSAGHSSKTVWAFRNQRHARAVR